MPRLTKEELAFIRENSKDYTIKGMAELLGIDHYRLLVYMNQSKLPFKPVRIPLTEQHKEYVRAWAGKIELREIVKEMFKENYHKNWVKVIYFCRREGIEWRIKKREKVIWMPDQIEQVRQAAQRYKKTA